MPMFEKTQKPIDFARLGVVAGRPHERVRVVDRAVEHGVGGHDRAACGQRGDLVAPAAHRRAVTGVAARHRDGADAREVRGRVNAQDLLVGGRPGAQPDELIEHAADVEQIAETALRLGILEGLLRLHVRLRRGRREVVPGARVVPGVALFPQPSSCHVGDFTGTVRIRFAHP